MNPTWWLAILACWYANVPFLYLTDQNVQRDLAGPWWKRSIKRLVLGRALFRLASGFLCAGTANQLLYQFYGVPDSKLVPFAFSWGFESLLQASQELKSKRNEIRAELGIPQESYVVLYCGRLSSEKSPMHLLQAYERVNQANKVLAIVGDGLLRQELQAYTAEKGLDSVHFFGFQDRHQIPRFYAIADVLVLPSDQETWGIVVNEAMCFGLPVIVSDGVGAARDLVRDGYNGLSFPRGDVPALTATIERLMGLPSEELSTMGERSRDLIVSWLKRDLAESLDRYFDHLHSKKARRGD
jgi:glycosyltransferase involved in cell wall biosynthesis